MGGGPGRCSSRLMYCNWAQNPVSTGNHIPDVRTARAGWPGTWQGLERGYGRCLEGQEVAGSTHRDHRWPRDRADETVFRSAANRIRWVSGKGVGVQSIIGATLLSLGLWAMLVSYWFAYGLGLKSGLIAAGVAPALALGIALDRRWPNAVLFAVAIAMGGGWIFMVLNLG